MRSLSTRLVALGFGLVCATFGGSRALAADIADFAIEWVDASAFPINVVYYSTQAPGGDSAGAMWVPDNVSVWEDGIEHRPSSFEDDEHAPAYLSLVIDSSGSMKGSLEEVLAAARKLIEQLDEQDRAEIVDFDSRVVTRRSFTSNAEEMSAALGQISVGGGTALYDAVATSLDHLENKPGMKVAIVLSDGEDENSKRFDLEKLEGRLRAEGVRVFTIALGEGVDTKTMEKIATLSGGAFHHADTADGVGKIYDQSITYLHSLHRFWYSTSLGMFDGDARTLAVEHKPSTIRHEASYQAPRDEYWSHAISYRRNQNAAPIKISPEGKYISQPDYRVLIDAEGRRLTKHDWSELYDARMTSHFVCGYSHRNFGALLEYKPEERSFETIEANTITKDATGDFHQKWEWYPKAISPNDQYLIMSANPDDDDLEYDYYFMLFDRTARRAVWEQGLYVEEFDEPGAVAVADNGLAAIVQDDNLFLVEPSGKVRFSRMWRKTGMRWQRLAMSADGRLMVARDAGKGLVWLSSTKGELVWKKRSACHEKGGFVAISANGEYVAYADHRGPHILNTRGKVLFELGSDEDFGIPEQEMQNGVDVANDGSFIYSIGNRIYFRRLD